MKVVRRRSAAQVVIARGRGEVLVIADDKLPAQEILDICGPLLGPWERRQVAVKLRTHDLAKGGGRLAALVAAALLSVAGLVGTVDVAAVTRLVRDQPSRVGQGNADPTPAAVPVTTAPPPGGGWSSTQPQGSGEPQGGAPAVSQARAATARQKPPGGSAAAPAGPVTATTPTTPTTATTLPLPAPSAVSSTTETPAALPCPAADRAHQARATHQPAQAQGDLEACRQVA